MVQSHKAYLARYELENVQSPTVNRTKPTSSCNVSDLTTSSEDEGKSSEIPDLLRTFKVGDILPARVTDVNNPLKFWIQLNNYQAQIYELHDKMQ